MAEWAFVIATNEYNCPKCRAIKGETCRFPSGVIRNKPHGARVRQLIKKDWKRCEGKSISLTDLIKN